ncbi:MAG TPA: L-threonylcarbamoyladenylate synthase [Candidatus Aminicenantes bacterium]|nr:L-threonylcarbamoyladenylate synthase [Candidatus Aminicenantes bacterium]HRY65465.1 L-threonylcarbamoyladenylate synthase [Candidatus Aminicenantes bacterium]HRZ72067.1 L-threonylcarbamoyladenylate synthase [Candidatus Aminicenantes bacterium]
MTKTRIVTLAPGEPFPAGEIARGLLAGAVAAYPTETFYALGAAAFNAGGVARVFRLKKRDASKPLSFIVSDLDMVREVVAPDPPGAFKVLAGEFWPGPLTLVLPAAAGLPDRLLGPGRTIALRLPPLAWLRDLVREMSEPLTATSANLAGEPEIADPRRIADLFGGRVDLVIDGGPAPGGRPSTIVDLAGEAPRLLREGPISAARIEAVLGARVLT